MGCSVNTERWCCDQRCDQGRGYCPLQEEMLTQDEIGEPLSTLENLQFWGAVAFAFCVFGACVSCVFFGAPK